MKKALFYHAGCPVCTAAEHAVAAAIDPSRFQVEIVHLGEATDRIAEAASHGVESVPAMVLDDQVFHINFGASLSDLTA
jgi:glutaredoxin